MTRAIILLSVLSVLVHVGCRPDEQDDTSKGFDLVDPIEDMRVDVDQAPDAGQPDMPDMIIEPDDMTMMPPREDMSPDEEDMASDMADMPVEEDMAPDMPPVEPLRQVVERGLMGDLPMENYIKDPTFNSLNTAYAWLVTPSNNQGGFSLLTAYRHVSASAPMRTSSLRIPKTSGNAVVVYGEVNLHPSVPVTVSVWIGRKGFVLGGNNSPPEISVYSMNVSDFYDYSGVVLEQVPGVSVNDGNIRWVKYEAQVSGLAGYGYLTITDTASSDLYVHAPMAVAVPPSPHGAMAAPVPPVRATPDQSSALRAVSSFVLEKRSIPAAAFDTGPTPYPF